MPNSGPSPASGTATVPSHGFRATRWSLVLAAGREDSPDRQAALETLCRTYWNPICGYVRQQGHAPADAQDLTQSFFAHILSRSWFSRAHPGMGRFRGFLLVSLKRFLINEAQRSRAIRRGGQVLFVPLDEDRDEPQRSPADHGNEASAERRFDREWALTVMQHAFARLKEDWSRRGKAEPFERLSRFLSREADAEDCAELGGVLGVKPGSVPVVLHRLRRSYGDLVRGEIAQTVATLAEVEEETRYLLELVCE